MTEKIKIEDFIKAFGGGGVKEPEHHTITDNIMEGYESPISLKLQKIALDRYIHRLKWNDIAEVEHLGRATVFRIHGRMLERMVKILRSGRFE